MIRRSAAGEQRVALAARSLARVGVDPGGLEAAVVAHTVDERAHFVLDVVVPARAAGVAARVADQCLVEVAIRVALAGKSGTRWSVPQRR